MSQTDDEKIYWDLVDEFIASANARCEDTDPAIVSAALLQATSRFNAFVVAASSLDRKAYIEEMDTSLNFLTDRYREHLREHLEDYRENYKVYMRTEDDQ